MSFENIEYGEDLPMEENPYPTKKPPAVHSLSDLTRMVTEIHASQMRVEKTVMDALEGMSRNPMIKKMMGIK